MPSTINASTASGGGIISSADSSGVLELQTAGTSALVIETTGNINIPGTGKRITGDFSTSTITNKVIFQTSSANSPTTLSVAPSGSNTTSYYDAWHVSSGFTNTAYARFGTNGSLVRIESSIVGSGTYLPITMWTSNSERLRIDTSGNVGIGTSSPVAKLELVSSGTLARFIGSGSEFQGFGIQNNYASGSNKGSVFYDVTNESGAVVSNMVSEINTDGSSTWYWGTQSAGSRTDRRAERMRIDSSGNLLVGTTTANGRISSVPKASFSPVGTAGSWANAPAISVSGSFGGGVSWVDGSGGYCAWVDDSGTDFNIAGNTTSGAVGNGVFLNGYSATSWSGRSDERLKDKLEPITDAINKVNSLRAVTGVYKNYPDDRQAFLLAQDVQAVLPEAVSIADKRSPEQYLGLAYTQVIPLLVAAIKELKVEVDSLKAQLENK